MVEKGTRIVGEVVVEQLQGCKWKWMKTEDGRNIRSSTEPTRTKDSDSGCEEDLW